MFTFKTIQNYELNVLGAHHKTGSKATGNIGGNGEGERAGEDQES